MQESSNWQAYDLLEETVGRDNLATRYCRSLAVQAISGFNAVESDSGNEQGAVLLVGRRLLLCFVHGQLPPAFS